MRMLRFFRGNKTPERQVERLIAKGERLFQHGREREGLEKFTEAANVLPEASKPSLHLGRAYAKLKRYPTALKHYYKALYFSEITDEAGILFEIAQVYMWMKRYDFVEEKLKKVLRLELPLAPPQIDTIRHTAVKALAQLYLRTGRISDAISQQKVLLEHAPENLTLIRQLAESYRRLGEYREARLLFRKAIELAHYSGQQAEIAGFERQLRQVSFPDGTEFGMKERLYAEYRSLCLGTAGDDGLRIPVRESLNSISFHDCLVTLRRLMEFIHAFDWPITRIVAADKHSTLLSAILACLLEVPAVAPSRITPDERILLCQTAYIASVSGKKLVKKLRKRAGSMVTFSLLAAIPDESAGYMPDIVGIPITKQAARDHKRARLIFSCSASETLFSETPDILSSEQFVQHALTLFAELPEECHCSEQIAYYLTQNPHSHPHLVPDSLAEVPGAVLHAQQPLERVVSRLLSTRREEVLLALAALREEHRQQPLIVKTLKTLYKKHQDSGLRRMIGRALLAVAPDEGIVYLRDLFYHPETDVLLQQAIVETLGNSSSRLVSPVIASALQASHGDVRKQAIRSVRLLDLSTDQAGLFERLLSDLPVIIVETLRYLRTDASGLYASLVRQNLPMLLRHADIAVVHESLKTLQSCEDRVFIPEVVALLRHPDHTIVAHAIRTLGAIADRNSGSHLVSFLEHASPHLRCAAAESITKLDQPQAVVFLLERLRQETPDVQEKLLNILGEAGSREITPYILQFAEQHVEHSLLVFAAVKAFARWQDSRSLPFIRKVVDTYPHDEMLQQYIAIAGAFGEKPDIERLIGYLGRSRAIQFQIAAVLYTQGFKRYFHILQDGIHSKYEAVNLLAADILDGIGDELSLQTLLTLFARQKPAIDTHLADVISRRQPTLMYAKAFHTLPSAEQEIVLQGMYRVIEASLTVQQTITGFHALYAVSRETAMSVMQQFCSAPPADVVCCGAMRCLVEYDPTGSAEYIRPHLSARNITVVNTAYRLMTRQSSYESARNDPSNHSDR